MLGEQREEKYFVHKNTLISLKGRSNFINISKNGETNVSHYFVMKYLPNNLAIPRVGLVTSRKVGNAVTRNKIKRQMRVIIKNFFLSSCDSLDYIVIVRHRAAKANIDKLRECLENQLKIIIKK